MKHIFAFAGLFAVCASNAQVTWHSGNVPFRDAPLWRFIGSGVSSSAATVYYNILVVPNPLGGTTTHTGAYNEDIGYVQIGYKSDEEGSYDSLWYMSGWQYGVFCNTFVALEQQVSGNLGETFHYMAYVVDPSLLAYPEEGDESHYGVGKKYTEIRVDARVVG
jgi:hypothetical protein